MYVFLKKARVAQRDRHGEIGSKIRRALSHPETNKSGVGGGRVLLNCGLWRKDIRDAGSHTAKVERDSLDAKHRLTSIKNFEQYFEHCHTDRQKDFVLFTSSTRRARLPVRM